MLHQMLRNVHPLLPTISYLHPPCTNVNVPLPVPPTPTELYYAGLQKRQPARQAGACSQHGHYLLATTLHSILPCVNLKVAPSPSTSSRPPPPLPHLHPCTSKKPADVGSSGGPILHSMSEQRKPHLLFSCSKGIGFMFPSFMYLYVPPALCSPHLYVPLCFPSSRFVSFPSFMLPRLYVPLCSQALQSLGSVFPQLYVPPLYVPAANVTLCS